MSIESKPPYSPEAAAQMYPAHSLKNIADHFGTNPARVRTDLLAMNIPMARPGRKFTYETPSQEELMKLIHEQDLNQRALAKEKKVSRHTIQNWLKRLHLRVKVK
jgi:hypothetical protein